MAIATVSLWPLARLIHAPGWVVPSLSGLRQRKLWWASIMIIIIVHNIISMGHLWHQVLAWAEAILQKQICFPLLHLDFCKGGQTAVTYASTALDLGGCRCQSIAMSQQQLHQLRFLAGWRCWQYVYCQNFKRRTSSVLPVLVIWYWHFHVPTPQTVLLTPQYTFCLYRSLPRQLVRCQSENVLAGNSRMAADRVDQDDSGARPSAWGGLLVVAVV